MVCTGAVVTAGSVVPGVSGVVLPLPVLTTKVVTELPGSEAEKLPPDALIAPRSLRFSLTDQ